MNHRNRIRATSACLAFVVTACAESTPMLEEEHGLASAADPFEETSVEAKAVTAAAVRLELSETGIVWDDDDGSAQVSVRAFDATTGAPVALVPGDITWYTTQPHNVALGTSNDEGDSISLLRVASGPVSSILLAAPSDTAPFSADTVYATVESVPYSEQGCHAVTCNENTRPREASCDTFPEPLQSEFAEIEYDGQGANGWLPQGLRVEPITGVVFDTKRFYFPVGSEHRAVSRTGKTMCFKLHGQYHCHVSGTTTGFTADWPSNFENSTNSAIGNCAVTDDSRFVFAYYTDMTQRDPSAQFNISGHSQGASDIAASGSMLYLEQGDQVLLLQPASANLGNQCKLNEAQCAGARVVAARTVGDIVSVGAEPTNTCINMPVMDDIRDPEVPCDSNPNAKPSSGPPCDGVHSAPYARHLYHLEANVPAGATCNPAFDASIVSNPGSPSSAFGTWELPPMARGSTEFDLCYCGIIDGYREECPGETPEACREPTDPAPKSNTGAPEPPADRAPPPNSPRPSFPSSGPSNPVGDRRNCQSEANGRSWWNPANECYEACPAGAISNSTAFGGSGATACICDIESGYIYDADNANSCKCNAARGFVEGPGGGSSCECSEDLPYFNEATNRCESCPEGTFWLGSSCQRRAIRVEIAVARNLIGKTSLGCNEELHGAPPCDRGPVAVHTYSTTCGNTRIALSAGAFVYGPLEGAQATNQDIEYVAYDYTDARTDFHTRFNNENPVYRYTNEGWLLRWQYCHVLEEGGDFFEQSGGLGESDPGGEREDALRQALD